MIDISAAKHSDLPSIHHMICALSDHHGDSASVTLDQLRSLLFGAHPQAEALLARINGDVVGYAGLTASVTLHTGRLRMDIHHLYITEPHRRSGVGRALIAAARARAIARKADRLTIGTDPNNAGAIAAYRAMSGLTEITGTGPRFWVELES